MPIKHLPKLSSKTTKLFYWRSNLKRRNSQYPLFEICSIPVYPLQDCFITVKDDIKLEALLRT
jgi:hypothetical protein